MRHNDECSGVLLSKPTRPIFRVSVLLLELFDVSELRHFLLRYVGPDILTHLPSGTSVVDFVDSAALALDRRGEIDKRFFDALIDARPKRQELIRDTALEWFGVIGEQKILIFRGNMEDFDVARLSDIVSAAREEIGSEKGYIIRIAPGSVRITLLFEGERLRWLRLLRYKHPQIFRPEQLGNRTILSDLEDILDVQFSAGRHQWLYSQYVEWKRQHGQKERTERVKRAGEHLLSRRATLMREENFALNSLPVSILVHLTLVMREDGKMELECNDVNIQISQRDDEFVLAFLGDYSRKSVGVLTLSVPRHIFGDDAYVLGWFLYGDDDGVTLWKREGGAYESPPFFWIPRQIVLEIGSLRGGNVFCRLNVRIGGING